MPSVTGPGLIELLELYGHANLWYVPTLRALKADGFQSSPRGKETYEFLHTVLNMPDPRKRVMTVPFRKANPYFQMAETVWILSGRQDAKWITKYNSRLSQFLDKDWDPDNFHGAYGRRLRGADGFGGKIVDQLQDVLDQLSSDPDSRRASVVLQDPKRDRPSVPTNDRPCNIAATYQIRDGRLYAATFNRSTSS